MALSATVHRLQGNLSDVDRGVYETLDVRLARHPSETAERLVTRALAYALSYEPDLEVGPGLCVGDEPAMSVRTPDGRLALYLDVGTPSGERMHRASKAAPRVVVYTQHDPALLLREAKATRIHRVEAIEVYALDRAMVTELAASLDRTLAWDVSRTEGTLYVTTGNKTIEGSVTRVMLGE